MSIPNYLNALANHQGPAKIIAGGLSIPVKIMDLEHRSNHYTGDMCTFNCLVVNLEEIRPVTEKNAVHITGLPNDGNADYVRQALAKADAWAYRDGCQKTPKPAHSVNPFEIKKVYFNDPVTVVLWADGTKTIVRCQEGDVYSKETGLALCFTKKALGNKGSFNDIFHKWIPEEEEVPVCHELQPFLEGNDIAAEAARRLGAIFTRALMGGMSDGK